MLFSGASLANQIDVRNYEALFLITINRNG